MELQYIVLESNMRRSEPIRIRIIHALRIILTQHYGIFYLSFLFNKETARTHPSTKMLLHFIVKHVIVNDDIAVKKNNFTTICMAALKSAVWVLSCKAYVAGWRN